MTLLLEGKDARGAAVDGSVQIHRRHPGALLRAVGLGIQTRSQGTGNDWIASARKIYSPALNLIFADAFYDLGWLVPLGSGTEPTTSALALADASPTTDAKPAMRLGQSGSLPAPDIPEEAAATATETQANGETAKPAAPAVAAAQSTAKPAVTKVAKNSPSVETHPAAAPAATALSPAQARAWSRPTFAERIDSASNPRTLLVAGLLLAGILLLAGLVVQQFRRSNNTTSLFKSAAPLTEPPFSDDQSASNDEHKVGSDLKLSGPPKLSLNLKASEPSVRAAVLPSGAISARGLGPGVDEPMLVSPDDSEESVAKEGVLGEVEAAPLRDKEEVSLPVEVPAAPLETKEAESIAAVTPPEVETPEPAMSSIEVPAAEPTAVQPPEVEIPAEVAPPAFAFAAHLAEEKAAPEATAPTYAARRGTVLVRGRTGRPGPADPGTDHRALRRTRHLRTDPTRARIHSRSDRTGGYCGRSDCRPETGAVFD